MSKPSLLADTMPTAFDMEVQRAINEQLRARVTELEADRAHLAETAADNFEKAVIAIERVAELGAALREASTHASVIQHRVCAYQTEEGDGRHCDCKFGGVGKPGAEFTGCAEARSIMRVARAALGGGKP
jgi:hypothetical protein